MTILSPRLCEELTTAGLPVDYVAELVLTTLAEDLQWGPDVTSVATLDPTEIVTADVVARADGCLAGVPIAEAVLQVFAAKSQVELSIERHRQDGERVRVGDVVLTVTGPVTCLLTAERSLLNLLCQLSGVATATSRWADALADTPTRVRDTRKTVPGLRIAQKYAVRCGGGVNHRMGLGDAALVKDNHVAACGSVGAAFTAIRHRFPDIPVEVECDRPAQVAEAIEAGAGLILLDNMSLDDTRASVALAKAAGVRTEASGGLTLERAAEVAACGVDYVAVGAITHSAPVLDLAFDVRA